jgi:hypothetical protein
MISPRRHPSHRRNVIRCQRCRQRCRNLERWNNIHVAGLVAGHLCPACQSPEEDLEAELNLVLHPPSTWRNADLSSGEGRVRYITQLIAQYPTPTIMRHKADLLAAGRSDAAELVRMMRGIADEMESGELYEDGNPFDDRFAQCVACKKPAPTTADQFGKWMLALDPDTQEQRAVMCPTCFDAPQDRDGD